MKTDVWREPVRGVWAHPEVLRAAPIDQFRGFLDGRLPAPPIGRLTGLHPTDAGLTHATFVLPVTRWLLNPMGAVQPACAALVSDAPLGAAFANSLPAGKATTTSELSISYLRPADLSAERLIARADVIKAGQSTGLTQAHITDAEGRLLAHATSRLVVLDVPPLPDAALPEHGTAPADDDPWRREAPGGILPPEVWQQRTGREILEGWLARELAWPPVHHLFGLEPVGIDGDEVVWSMPAHEWLCSPGPFLYGGALALLADSVLSTAVMVGLPAGTTLAPLDLRMRFVRPVFAGSGTITAHARTVHLGRGLAISQGELRTADGKVAVLAESSMLLRAAGG